MRNNIEKWFGLKRANFILDPRTDADFYAPRSGVDIPKLIEGLEVNLVTQMPPKRIFWGVYGGGKTHTLFHISSQLEKLLPIFPIYVECPSVPKNSTFLHLYHDGIMASIGQDRVISLFIELLESMQTIRRDELLPKLNTFLGDEELSRATYGLLVDTPEKQLAFWRYISGASISSVDLKDLKLTSALSDTIPSRLASIVIIIGKIFKKIKKKTLVLILDELDRLGTITDVYGGATYEEAFRRLVDENQRDLSILMSYSARTTKNIPSVFGSEAGPILSRIGTQNIIPISEILASDVDNFIKKIVQYIVNDKAAQEKIKKIGKIKETLMIEYFPFTIEAIEALKGTLRGIMTPREITQRMSDAAGKAFLRKQPVITSEIIGA